MSNVTLEISLNKKVDDGLNISEEMHILNSWLNSHV